MKCKPNQTKPNQTKHTLRRLAALGLCSAMLIGAVPISANAEDEETTVTEPTETIEPTATETPSQPQSQKITVKTASKSFKAKWICKNKKPVSCLESDEDYEIGAKAKTSLSYKVLNGSKYVSVSSKGRIKLKKGTPSGTYKIKVTAAATDEYAAAVTTVKVTVKKASAQLKDLNISWDLKNNKTVTYETNFGEPGTLSFFKKGKIKIKNYKVTNAQKKGYKKLTLTFEITYPSKFTKKQVDSILVGYYEPCGTPVLSGTHLNKKCLGNYGYLTLVDYETGASLETKNTKNVKAKFGKWKYPSTEKKNYGSGSGWISCRKYATCSLAVTYPKNYKNLCIIAGGESNCYYYSKSGSVFEKGKITFAEALNLYSAKGRGGKRKVCHGLRVK